MTPRYYFDYDHNLRATIRPVEKDLEHLKVESLSEDFVYMDVLIDPKYAETYLEGFMEADYIDICQDDCPFDIGGSG